MQPWEKKKIYSAFISPERDSIRKEEETPSSASTSPGKATASQRPSGRTAHGRLGEGDATGTTKQVTHFSRVMPHVHAQKIIISMMTNGVKRLPRLTL